MTVKQSCGWCHTIVTIPPTGPVTCPQCGHRADIARLFCDCLACRLPQPVPTVATPPAKPPERVETLWGGIEL